MLTQSDHLTPALLLGRRRQLAHVHMCHATNLGLRHGHFKLTKAGSISVRLGTHVERPSLRVSSMTEAA